MSLDLPGQFQQPSLGGNVNRPLISGDVEAITIVHLGQSIKASKIIISKNGQPDTATFNRRGRNEVDSSEKCGY
jgi:hypothetical protein